MDAFRKRFGGCGYSTGLGILDQQLMGCYSRMLASFQDPFLNSHSRTKRNGNIIAHRLA